MHLKEAKGLLLVKMRPLVMVHINVLHCAARTASCQSRPSMRRNGVDAAQRQDPPDVMQPNRRRERSPRVKHQQGAQG